MMSGYRAAFVEQERVAVHLQAGVAASVSGQQRIDGGHERMGGVVREPVLHPLMVRRLVVHEIPVLPSERSQCDGDVDQFVDVRNLDKDLPPVLHLVGLIESTSVMNVTVWAFPSTRPAR
jgi:hypothetical protein